jgi:sec-independent protein translocase protein TatC
METEVKQDEPSALDLAILKYTPYLKELQTKLFTVFCVFLGGGVLGFIYYQQILSSVMHLFQMDNINLVLTSPYQFIDLAVGTGLLIGIILALPLLGYFLLTFVRPALASREYSLLLRLYPLAILLFVIGFFFGGWIIQLIINLYSQTTLDFSVNNLWDVSHFFNQILMTGISLALIFELPIVLTVLLKLKLIKLVGLKKSRKFIYAAILVFVAFLPPNDIISLALLSIPPLLLFEITLLLNQKV